MRRKYKVLAMGFLCTILSVFIFSTEMTVAKSERLKSDNNIVYHGLDGSDIYPEKTNENYTGWIQLENTWYYNNGGVMQTGWL